MRRRNPIDIQRNKNPRKYIFLMDDLETDESAMVD